jgi:transcription termination/antitermination protein NusA
VLVPEDQLSLAIGKEGQNARLAARLTSWKIDIKDAAKYDAVAAMKEVESQRQSEYPSRYQPDYQDAGYRDDENE